MKGQIYLNLFAGTSLMSIILILILSLEYNGHSISIVHLVKAIAYMWVLFIYLLMVLFFEASCRLKYRIKNQAEYAYLQFVLEFLIAIGATHIEASSDSLQVVHKCLSSTNVLTNHLFYLHTCLDVNFILNCFIIAYASGHEN